MLGWQERRRVLECQDVDLLSECAKLPLNSSGAGGQKRDRKYSGIRLIHKPTGVQVVSTATRSRARNESDALGKLRMAIALEIRCPWDVGERSRLELPKKGRPTPAMVADLFDLLEDRGFRIGEAVKELGVSTASLVKFVSRDKMLWRRLNERRMGMGLSPLTMR